MKIFFVYSVFFAVFFIHRIQEYYQIEKTLEYPADKKADECCCPINKLKETNDRIFPVLENLRKTYFFKIFRINLEKDCNFWVKQKICTSSSCVLCKCDENEIPSHWNKSDFIIKEETYEKNHGWTDKPNTFEEFIVEDKETQQIGSYINLEKNPESYTGYQGRNIWPAIYKENCFGGEPGRELCHEETLFNRLISGLHASINSHIFEYFVDPETKENIPNFEVYFERVGNFPDRIENIFFAYSVFLRAINVAADFVHEYDIRTGFHEEDEKSHDLLMELLEYTQKNCDSPFREDEFFSDVTKNEIKIQIEKYISNITQIMDCVECEKCRVHGTLQIYGLGAAFKILFSDDRRKELVYLKRNEFTSLIVTFAKFSRALKIIEWMYERRYSYFVLKSEVTLIAYVLGYISLLIVIKIFKKKWQKIQRKFKKH